MTSSSTAGTAVRVWLRLGQIWQKFGTFEDQILNQNVPKLIFKSPWFFYFSKYLTQFETTSNIQVARSNQWYYSREVTNNSTTTPLNCRPCHSLNIRQIREILEVEKSIFGEWNAWKRQLSGTLVRGDLERYYIWIEWRKIRERRQIERERGVSKGKREIEIYRFRLRLGVYLQCGSRLVAWQWKAWREL